LVENNMRNLFRNLGLLIAFSIVFSGLFGCTGSSSTEESVNGTKADSKEEKTSAPKDEGIDLPAPVAAAETKMLEGDPFKFSDTKGRVILVNLWATWCGPCREEMPELVKMQEKYRDKKFEIVGLDVDPEPEAQVKKFVEKMGLNYKIGWAERDLVAEFIRLGGGKQGIPQSFLINREGKLVAVFTGVGPRVINKMKETVDRIVNE